MNYFFKTPVIVAAIALMAAVPGISSVLHGTSIRDARTLASGTVTTIKGTVTVPSGAFASSTLLRLLNSGADKKLVADQFLRWNKVQGKEVKGLTNRRKLERELFLK